MNILSTIPSQAETGLPLNQVIEIEFDEEVDVQALLDGGLIVISPAEKVVSFGPGMEDFLPRSHEWDLLRSETFRGFVDGEIASEDGITFTFTPDSDLEPGLEYQVLINKDLVSRTLSDIAADVVTGTGRLSSVTGPYQGDVDDAFSVTVTTAGALGTAKFRVLKTTAGYTSPAEYVKGEIEIVDGLILSFEHGQYELGDTWTFDATVGVPLETTYRLSFTTGASEALSIPRDERSIELAETEVDGLTRIDGLIRTTSGLTEQPDSFRVISTTPEDLESNVRLGQVIEIVFNKDIDPASISTATIKAFMETLPFYAEQDSVELKVTVTLKDERTLSVRFTG